MNIHNLLLALLLSASLSACTTMSRTPLPPQAAAGITSVNTKLSIPGDEVIVRAQASNISASMGYGLIPALIEGSINASKQNALETLSSRFYAKQHVDFREVFSQSFNAGIQQQNTLPKLQFAAASTGLSKSILADYKAKLTPEGAFLGVRIWYEFSSDLTQILVLANAQLINKQAQEPVYKNELVYVSASIGTANPLEAWALNNGEALSKAFAESGTELARLLQQDLAAPDNESVFRNLAQNEPAKFLFPGAMPIFIEGHIAEKTEQRKIIRAKTGALYSTPN